MTNEEKQKGDLHDFDEFKKALGSAVHNYPEGRLRQLHEDVLGMAELLVENFFEKRRARRKRN